MSVNLLQYIPINSVLIDHIDDVCVAHDSHDENGEEKFVDGVLFFNDESSTFYFLYTYNDVIKLHISKYRINIDNITLAQRYQVHEYMFGKVENCELKPYDYWLSSIDNSVDGIMEFIEIKGG